MKFSYKPGVELKDEFEESEVLKIETINYLKSGWIELDDFIEKYWGITKKEAKKHKRDYWIRRLKKFDSNFQGQVGKAIVVHENAFCIFTKNIYKGGVKNEDVL